MQSIGITSNKLRSKNILGMHTCKHVHSLDATGEHCDAKEHNHTTIDSCFNFSVLQIFVWSMKNT